MGFTHKYIRDRKFVLTLVNDSSNDNELLDAVHELTRETRDMHPFVELTDTTAVHDFSGFTENGISVAGSMEFERTPHKRDKLAILVANDQAYHLATRYASTSKYFRYDTRIFKNYKEAITWLGVADLEEQINELRRPG